MMITQQGSVRTYTIFPYPTCFRTRQLRHVVGRRIGLDGAQFAEVVDRMGAVAGAAADAEQEQPAAPCAQTGKLLRQGFDDLRIDRLEIGGAHVCTPVTNAQLVWRLPLEKTKITKPTKSTTKQ